MNDLGFWKKHIFSIVVLAALCFGTYANSLQNQFLIDDYGLILENPQIRNSQNLLLNFVPQKLHTGEKVYYRPIPHLLIMLNYLWFKENPVGYHGVNIFLFFLGVSALYAFVCILLGNWKSAFWTAVFFAVHPINGMLVNYMTATGYSVLLGATFLSLIFFLKAFAAEKIETRFLVGGLFWLTIALLCHETAMIFPLYLAAAFYFIRRKTGKKVLLDCLPSILWVGIYFLFRLNHASLKVNIVDKISLFQTDFLGYCGTFFKLILWYVVQLLAPQGVVLIWGTPVVTEYIWLWAIGLFVFLGGSIFFVARNKGVFPFALAFFWIGLIPVTLGCLFQPRLGFMLEPHWVLFSSFGFFLLLGDSFRIIYDLKKAKIFLVLPLITALGYFSASREHNQRWKDEETYCQYWLKEVPGYQSALFHLASSYMRQGKRSQARETFNQALSGYPDDWEIYSNLGWIEFEEKNFIGAIQYFEKALMFNPNSGVIYTNLGSAYLQQGSSQSAAAAFEKSIAIDPTLLEPRINLANLWKAENKLEQAIELLQQNLQIDPLHPESTLSLIALYLAQGKKDKAQDLAKKIFEYSGDPVALTHLGSLMASQGYISTALSFFSKALQIDPHSKEAFLEMGKVYGNQNDFKRAIIYWQEGLSFHPDEQQFKDLISQAQSLQEK